MNPFNINLSNFSLNASIWMYVGDTRLDNDQAEKLMDQARVFCEGWKNHGTPVSADAIMLENQVLIFIVDKSKVGGCSIDSSVRFVKELGESFNLDFFNRMLCGFIADNQFEVVPVNQVATLSQEGKINSQTLVLNTLVKNRKDLEETMFVAIKDSWYSRYLKE